jgi:hypothetical protein
MRRKTNGTLSRPIDPGSADARALVRSQLKASLNAGTVLAIDRRQQVYLRPFQGDGPRFVRLFRSTWRRLPLWARRRILGFWHDADDAMANLVLHSPHIELLDGWSKRQGEGLRGDVGCVSHGGHFLQFHAPVVDLMPEPLVCDLIAHELAHVHQDACGIRLKSVESDGTIVYEDARGGVYMAGELEEEADATMVSWGFDDEAMDQWAVEQGIVTVVDATREQCIEAGLRFMRTGQR